VLFQGEVVVSAERFKDGWMRGIRIRDLAVGFFPSSIVRRTGEESVRTKVAEASSQMHIYLVALALPL
jgi:hypothetical protein